MRPPSPASARGTFHLPPACHPIGDAGASPGRCPFRSSTAMPRVSPPNWHRASDTQCHPTPRHPRLRPRQARRARPAIQLAKLRSPSFRRRPHQHPPVTDFGLPDRDILQYFSTPNLHSIRCSAGDAGSRSRASRRGFMFCTHAHSSGNRARRPRVRRRSGIRRLRRPPT